MTPRVLFVSRERFRLPLNGAQKRKWDAVAQVVDHRVLAAAPDGRQQSQGDETGDFRLLAPLLQVTTELDPKLLPAYQFGANFLAPKPPNGAGLPGAAGAKDIPRVATRTTRPGKPSSAITTLLPPPRMVTSSPLAAASAIATRAASSDSGLAKN